MTGQDAGAQQGQSKLRGFDDFELRLGDIMRGERATLGKSLLDVQRELKIKATYIAAIENTDPSAFETPGFIAGYVRSYARYLGLDSEWAYKTFCEEGNFQTAHGMSAEASARRPAKGPSATVTGPRDPFTEPSVSFVPASKPSVSLVDLRALGSIAVLLVLIGGIGYGGWSVLQEVQKVRFTPVEQAPTVVSELDAPTTGPSDFAGASEPAARESVPTVEAFDRLYRPEALDVPVLTARDGPIATLDPARVGAFATEPGEGLVTARLAPAPLEAEPVYGDALVMAEIAPEDIVPVEADVPAVQVVEATAPEVVLFAVRPAWVRVRAADGSVIFEKILDPGEEFDLPLTEAPATLRAGNAQSVFFRVNGVTYGPAGENASVVSSVALGPADITDRYAEADLSRDEDLARYVDLSGGAAQ